jgi:hypothetical protein
MPDPEDRARREGEKAGRLEAELLHVRETLATQARTIETMSQAIVDLRLSLAVATVKLTVAVSIGVALLVKVAELGLKAMTQ